MCNTPKVIGQMDNSIDHTLESANRIYSIYGISPNINTCGGGGHEAKVVCTTQKAGES